MPESNPDTVKDDLLTHEEQELVIGAIPLQALPDNWYVGDCAKCHAMVVDCCNQCERCRDHCICWRGSHD